MRHFGPLHAVVTSADYLIAGLGPEPARLVLRALRAGWLTPEEAETLEPLAAAIAFLLGDVDVPQHRGSDARTVRIHAR